MFVIDVDAPSPPSIDENTWFLFRQGITSLLVRRPTLVPAATLGYV